VSPNFTELAQLAAIRTALNFFLGLEIKEERQLVQADHAAAVQRADGRLGPAEKPVRVRADRDAGPVPGGRADLRRAQAGRACVMITIVHDAALLVTAAGLVVAVVALARTRRIPLSLSLLLDFFTAASLLRLVGPPTWSSLAAAALTITIRQLASRGLRIAQRTDRLSIMRGRPRALTIRAHPRRR
jgi:uncharacterized membrane protein